MSTALRLRTWFSIDPQPASISPTINISIVFICAFPFDCGQIICHPAIKNDSSALPETPAWQRIGNQIDAGRGAGVGRGLGVGVALGVLKRNVQVNSATGWPVAQLKAPAEICMVLRPCTTGEVLKMKVMVRSSGLIVSESAGVPLTVKSLAWTVAGSTASLRLIMKIVGWVNITPGQEVVTEQVCASANGTA